MRIIQTYKSIRTLSEFEVGYAIYSVKKMKKHFINSKFVLYLDMNSNLPDTLLCLYDEIIPFEDKYSSRNIWAGSKFQAIFKEKEPFCIIDLDASIIVEEDVLKKYDFVFAHMEISTDSEAYLPKELNPNYSFPNWFDSDFPYAMNCSFIFFNKNTIEQMNDFKEIFDDYLFHNANYNQSNSEHLQAPIMCMLEQWLMFQFFIYKNINMASFFYTKENLEFPLISFIENEKYNLFKHIGIMKWEVENSLKKGRIETWKDSILMMGKGVLN